MDTRSNGSLQRTHISWEVYKSIIPFSTKIQNRSKGLHGGHYQSTEMAVPPVLHNGFIPGETFAATTTSAKTWHNNNYIIYFHACMLYTWATHHSNYQVSLYYMSYVNTWQLIFKMYNFLIFYKLSQASKIKKYFPPYTILQIQYIWSAKLIPMKCSA